MLLSRPLMFVRVGKRNMMNLSTEFDMHTIVLLLTFTFRVFKKKLTRCIHSCTPYEACHYEKNILDNKKFLIGFDVSFQILKGSAHSSSDWKPSILTEYYSTLLLF